MQKINNSIGAKCSQEGKRYELQIYNIAKHCLINQQLFNLQQPNELGGSCSRNDIECRFNDIPIPIEIKKHKTPDWMQMSLHYDQPNQKWIGGNKNKIPDKSKQLFETLIGDAVLFNGKIPPFLTRNITHTEWKQIKQETPDFKDIYLDCPDNTIQQLYAEKGCYYIQLSNKGLYHLGNDICEFNVPAFICNQQLRIRTKIHTRENKNGFCQLSITVACQPTKIQDLVKSPYSLDDTKQLPPSLIYQEIETLK